ncbi:large conductance mechanosensitive channel protein MscL [Flavonifractor sp. AGMB03687]|uniref:large conductance mechanosensitive channel protein MscL n=1 Tax=Flavonifractor sp. AGMB03687 TaxID=2785133 RepID=UPI001AE09419|nr:large conductance mechanosensitive channel protein MscL [Flavonifractor sp. AGMB03687]
MSTKEKTTGFVAEFKQFIARGSVMDMAVGVIIGGAFKAIADSLVNDIINPILGIFTSGSSDLANLAIHLPGGGDMMVGNFINAILNFLIMAFVVFCIIKGLNRFHRKKDETPAPPPAPPEPSVEEKLLMEIRDLLKEQTHE